MDWYIGCLRKYADFSGRARRKEYWMFALVNFIIFCVAVFLILIAGGAEYNAQGWMAGQTGASPLAAFLYIVLSLYWVAIIVPALAVSVRRLHDIGKSGWWWFIQFVPAIGGIWFFVLMVLDSQGGANEWGPNPKENAAAVPAVS